VGFSWHGLLAVCLMITNDSELRRRLYNAVAADHARAHPLDKAVRSRASQRLHSEGGNFRVDSLFGKFLKVSHFNDLAHIRLSRGSANGMTKSKISTRFIGKDGRDELSSPSPGNPGRSLRAESTVQSRWWWEPN